jgi:hypothetical protein
VNQSALYRADDINIVDKFPFLLRARLGNSSCVDGGEIQTAKRERARPRNSEK